MDKEQRITFINAMTVCAQIECAGMVAENEQRKISGKSPAYLYNDFENLQYKHGIFTMLSFHTSKVTDL